MESLETKSLALLRIWQILCEESDEKHPLTQPAIIRHLDVKYDIKLERKAVSRYVSKLEEAGIEILHSRKGIWLAERDFEDSELHLLVDGVLCSKYITAKHSKDLIDKICGLGNRYFRAGVRHIHSVKDWNKTDNQALFYHIGLVDEAIEGKKQIRYTYNKYGLDKKLRKTSTQQISPYLMLLHNQKYYLMGYSDYWGKMVFHKMDHITDMQVVGETAHPLKKVPGYEGGIDYKMLSSGLPYMYTDRPERIEFFAREGIVDQLVEWFGQNLEMKKSEREGWLRAVVTASPNAMVHWAMQYGGNVEILSPEPLRERVKEQLAQSLELYK